MMPKGFAAAALFTLLSGATVGYYSVPSLAQQSGGANTPYDTKHGDWEKAPNGTAVQPEYDEKYPGDSPSRGVATTKDDMDAESFRPTGGDDQDAGSATVTQEPADSSTTSTSIETAPEPVQEPAQQEPVQEDMPVDQSTEVAPDTTTSTSTDTDTMNNDTIDQTTSTSAAPQEDTSADTSASTGTTRRARSHRHARRE
jgi:hypothetical protein